MQQRPPLRFPKEFLWGASTAAHQVEGGTTNQWTAWESDNAKALAMQASYKLDEMARWPDIRTQAMDSTNYISGNAVEHFSRYKTDFDLVKQMNMNAFRFSIEWSRIEPEEGKWDRKAVEHYRTYIQELRKRNIEPVMTLLHFTLPTWFAKKGGFEHKKNIRFFVRYAEYVMTQIARDVTYVITINEPEIYAVQGYLTSEWPPQKHSKILALKVLNNQLAAHNKVARMIHAIGRTYKVSIAKNTAHYYAADDTRMTKVNLKFHRFVQEDYVMKRVVGTCDFIGLNYYFANRMEGRRIKNENTRTSDLGWDMQPAKIQDVLVRLSKKYNKPIIITENGLADMHDKERRWWIAHTLVAMDAAIKKGVKLEGYLHWSLLDNFEWAYGKWPRFGLVSVNYETMERRIRPSAKWFGTIVGKLRKDSW